MTKSWSKAEILSDLDLCIRSRQASYIGRKEVLTGKAKFGIFGDGKELPQVLMAKFFKAGDFRSGYYRDQTFMMAINQLTVQEFFAQLYAHTDIDAEPSTAGRSMNGHFGTRLLDENGQWKNQKELFNSSADISPTGSQMPRLLGLAFASKIYRENPSLSDTIFSNNGNEIAWGTIGNASSSEGMFFESINAAGVLQVPMIINIWDDHYGISVPAKYQTTKENISEILKGFQRDNSNKGFEIITVNGWEYPSLYSAYSQAEKVARIEHVPVLIHVKELTQPQGHSTSGSHERYKSRERLDWEKEYDCIEQFKLWIIREKIAKQSEVEKVEAKAIESVKEDRNKAWDAYRLSIDSFKDQALSLIHKIQESDDSNLFTDAIHKLEKNKTTYKRDIVKLSKKILYKNKSVHSEAVTSLKQLINDSMSRFFDEYNSFVYSHSNDSISHCEIIPARYAETPKIVDGREVLQACFDYWLEKNPYVIAFGEDVGKIGDVNQAFSGLQDKYGEIRISDTGIREVTIVGQGIGAALRGLRPICEIQYLDYILYATQIISDDLACLQYRSKGGQKAPLIIRTRGHRLEGIWHSGSPMGHIIHAFHGVYVCVPRNMTQAAGFYNLLLRSDEPALIVECLNAYRLKEALPENIGEFTLALGQPEILHTGSDITVVSYGSMLRIIEDAMEELLAHQISIELIDVQTLIPFDSHGLIKESLRKTNRIAFIDEDMPGATTAYMMQMVCDRDNGWELCDSKPICISAPANRPAYGTDGDYFCKPNAEDIFERLYHMMHEANPQKYPPL